MSSPADPLPDLDRIDALAKAATPGPWRQSGYVHAMGWGAASSAGNEEAPLVFENAGRADAAYLAALDPQTWLRFSAALRKRLTNPRYPRARGPEECACRTCIWHSLEGPSD